MDHFDYKDSVLHAENVSILDIAKQIGTPFYCYSTATFTRHFTVFDAAFDGIDRQICFAVKANSNIAVLKLLGDLGAGADTVSGGEIKRALRASIDPAKMVFSGVGKTRDELRFALEQNIGQFNVESIAELHMLHEEAEKLGVKAPIALRVNPDIAAGTHDKISTGRKQDKFGIAWESIHEAYNIASTLSGLNVLGVATHIGSQLTQLEPFEKAFRKIAGLVHELRQEGHVISRVDLGGGLGIPYENETPPSPADYGDLVKNIIQDLDVKLMLEPGRLIAGNAGILVSSVVLKKQTSDQIFLVIDAAMNDLARPALYDSYHEIVAVQKADTTEKADVVGQICESSDVFGRNRNLPPLHENDLIAIRSAGAYGAVMASTYNTRELVPEVLVKDNVFAVIRKRQTMEDLLDQDIFPDFI